MRLAIHINNAPGTRLILDLNEAFRLRSLRFCTCLVGNTKIQDTYLKASFSVTPITKKLLYVTICTTQYQEVTALSNGSFKTFY